MVGSPVMVNVCRSGGEMVEARPGITAPVDLLGSAAPWRTFRWAAAAV
jgi:hypothetical protein